MMTPQTLSTSSGAATYYSQADNYYFVGQLLTAWHGKLAEEMGLSGNVDLKTFAGLLEGITPDGRKMGKKHRPGLDLTFSAPKSLSILGLVGGDDRLIEAFRESVSETIKEVEAFISTRITKDKQTSIETTGKGIFASFVHDTSRNLDPQLHMHVIAMNITEKDGKLYSLSSDKRYGSGFMEMVYTHHTLFGTVQRNILEKKVTDLGYTTRPTGKGLWEISGVPVDLLGHFSSRSRDIRRAVGDTASFASRSIAALDTRSPKQVPDREKLLTEWNDAIRDHGFDLTEFIDVAKAHESGSIASEIPQPGQHDVTPDMPEVSQSEAIHDIAQQGRDEPTDGASVPALQPQPTEPQPSGTELDEKRLHPQTVPEKASSQGSQQTTNSEQDDRIIHTALSSLSNRKRDFSYNDVVLEMGASTENVVTLRDGERLINRAIESGKLIPLNDEKSRFTAQTLLIDEKVVVELTRDHVANGLVSGTRRPLENALPQLADKPVTIISTASSVRGVKDVINQVVNDQADRGRSVTVLSPTANRRDQIEHAAEGKMIFSDLSDAETTFARNSTVIVDNAERMSARDSINLLSQARENNLQLILLDTAARSSQTNVLSLFRDGGAVSSKVQTDHENFSIKVTHAPDKAQRGRELAGEYAAAFSDETRPVVVASTPLDKRQLTDEIRASLKVSGAIDGVGEGVKVETRNEVFMTIAEKKKVTSWRTGYVIEDRTERRPEVFTVGGISEDTKSLILLNDKGERQTIKASSMGRKDVRVFESALIEVVPGEILKASAAVKNQGIRAKDSLRVYQASEREITGLNERTGQEFTLYTREPVYASYGYVSGMGEVNRAEGKVIAALSKRDLNANNINSLNMSGSSLSIYSPMDEQTTVNKIQNMSLRNTVSEYVMSTAHKTDIDAATEYLKEQVATPEAIALNRAITGVQTVSVHAATLLTSALRMDKRISPEALRDELDSRIASGELISLSGDGVTSRQNPRLVPRVTYEVEKDILGMVTAGYATRQPLAIGVDADRLEHLTAGQRDAISDILTGSDTFQLVQGYAGVGKTTKLATLQMLLNETMPELEIRGIGPTHRAVGEMSGAGITAQTAKSFILDSLKDEAAGIRHDHSNTLFIVDEASMVGNSDMRDTLGLIDRAGGRAVIIGDRQQFLPIESGAPFQLTQERTPARLSVMKDIVRQTNPALREAVYSTINGDHTGSLKQLEAINNDIVPRREGSNGMPYFNTALLSGPSTDGVATVDPRMPEINGPSIQGNANAQTVAFDYLSRTDEARADTMVITGTNAVRREINTLIQNGLIEDGSLSEARKTTVPVYSQLLIARSEFHDPDTWFSGAVVINDGDYFRVEQAGSEGVIVRSMESGLRQEWDYRGLDSTRMEIFEEKHTRFLEGDRVLLRKTDIDTGKTSNEAYRVQTIRDNGEIVLEGKSGLRELNPSVETKDRHIDLGYAVTSTGAQGASTRYDIGFMGTEGAEKSLSNARAYYILISRAKEHAQIYTDSVGKLESILNVSREPKQTAHDVLHARTQAEHAGSVAQFAAPLDTFYAGRVLAETYGLDTATTELKLLSRTPTAPLRVMLPAYDENGKMSGMSTWALAAARGEFHLGEPRTDAEKNTMFTIVQRGSTPEIMSAGTLPDALALVRKHPQASVIIAPDGYEQHSVVLDTLDVERITSVMMDEIMPFAEETPALLENADDLPDTTPITVDATYDQIAEHGTNNAEELDTDLPGYGEDSEVADAEAWETYGDMMAQDNTPALPDYDVPASQSPTLADDVPELPETHLTELPDFTPAAPVLPDVPAGLPEWPEPTDAATPETDMPQPDMHIAQQAIELPDLTVADLTELIVPEAEIATSPDVPAGAPELPDMIMPDVSLPVPDMPAVPVMAHAVLPELPGDGLPELSMPEIRMPEVSLHATADLHPHLDEIAGLKTDDLSLPAVRIAEHDFSLPEPVEFGNLTTLGPDERENYDPTLKHDLGEFEFTRTISKEI